MTQSAFEAALAAFTQAGGDVSQLQNASPIGQDRLVRKETSLGAVREIDPPMEHIGDSLAPWLPVETDDVIFDYLTVQTDGLAPARAEDAESELAQKDETTAGQGRASVIDWSLKDHYDASDVKNAVDLNRIAEQMRSGTMPLLVQSQLQDWNSRVARDRALRRRKLDNRREWLIINGLSDNQIVYNDGKIKFTVPYGRPASQQAGSATFNHAGAGIANGAWDLSNPEVADPIRFFTELSEWFFDTYGVRLGTAIGAKKIFNQFWLSQKFSQRAGLGGVYDAQGNVGAPDLLYATTGWSPNAARAVVESSTGVTLREYDAVYRTRPVGSNTVTANRFLPKTRLILLPNMADMAEVAATRIGFAKTLTSPHPEGNWASGYYEWERSTVDPWGQDVGNGIKMFPVFPHLEYSATVDVVLPA
jgi:hypothetical protein